MLNRPWNDPKFQFIFPSAPSDFYWTKIFDHDVTKGGLFSDEAEAGHSDKDGAFSRLDSLNDHQNLVGQFHLKLSYPETGMENEWIQESSPVTSEENSEVSGYRGVDIGMTGEGAGTV